MNHESILDHNEKLFKILFDKDEVTWQSLLYELVKTEQMDPWDINVTLLTKKYIETIKQLKELDLRLSGKVLLAAAILLKIKSNRLLNEDLSELDRLLTQPEEGLGDELDIEDAALDYHGSSEKPVLLPRTPQPRKRKVSIFDLVNALEKALQVKKRRVLNSMPPMNLKAPKRTKDVTQIIKEVYGKIKSFFIKNEKNKLTFSQLLPSDAKEDKVYTFIPLLHLTNQRKIDLSQEEHFGEIKIMLNAEKEVNKDLGAEV